MHCLLQCPEICVLKKECAVNGEKPVMLLLSQGTPTAGTISRRSQVLQFDEGEESDCDIEMIGEDSEDDVVNSETESESEEDQRGMVDCVLNSVSPPSH